MVVDVCLQGEGIGPITIKVKISAQHIEVNLNEAKGYEKHVIVELIKETHNAISNTAVKDCNHDNCRGNVLYISIHARTTLASMR